ncbi:MAG: vitamin B12-dependent ribonucleotide reductase [Candidatus Brennerbacteria bacterium]|nr:vitamin B12-dependent ribonucleotide reductase [Candidatus Brennerbacteria bacterium]
METTKKGIQWERLFGNPTTHPFEDLQWVLCDVSILDKDGKKVVFEQKRVEVPEIWREDSRRNAASKYFRVPDGGTREHSVKQMLERVARTIATKGLELGYFDSEESRKNFERDIVWLTLHQYMAFNSPVWFNVGIEDTPQCSACFILSVEDNMRSILKWYETEGMIFKQGSGSGANVSNIRSSKEELSRGGIASGPVSFMHGADSVANVIRSGGATRRAAKMVTMNVDHPDIRDFIRCKAEMEKMARVLAEAGFDTSLNGKLFSIYTTLPYQNANNAVRATNEFMEAVVHDQEWALKAVTSGKTLETVSAKEILREIAAAAWFSGDPGMQFDTTINDWHTCPNSGRINGSNPCSEYMHLDDSACNLASLNLLKFLREDGSIDVEFFRKAVHATFLAQEIIIGFSSYPTQKITENARKFREIGLGYANLGALLMALGLPYDSDEARTLTGAITALMTAEAYHESAEIAAAIGPCEGFFENKEPMQKVLQMHRMEAHSLTLNGVGFEALVHEAERAWIETCELAERYGVRNTQATVLAPTGTISFLMACDTTGIEPDLALIKYKNLVGGGQLAIENQQVEPALKRIGYSETQIGAILQYLRENGTVEGAPGLKEEHLPVFDCSYKPEKGTRFIHYMGHLKMMAAAQPFISGAISKTVNLPHSATVEDFEKTYLKAWELGLKAVALYREGSKVTEVLSTKKSSLSKGAKPARRRLAWRRPAENIKIEIGGQEGYLTPGKYEDGDLGEMFIEIAKGGSTLYGMTRCFSIAVSIGLQYGAPLKAFVKQFMNQRFEPAGFTPLDPDIHMATSIVDYVFRRLALDFLSKEDQEELGVIKKEEEYSPLENGTVKIFSPEEASEHDGKTCLECGSLMKRAGTCYTCPQCFSNTGCG